MSNIKKISFIGLGVMGFPVAGHLAEKSGAAVTAYNRTESKADAWLERYKGRKAATPKEAVDGADLTMICVGNDDDLREIMTGPGGVLAGAKQGGAEAGQLTVMAGGDEATFSLAEPIIKDCYAKEIRLMGPSGAGQLTKMVNQLCIAGTLQGLSEGLAFGMKAGLDMGQVLEVIGKGAAQSWQMDNRGKTMVRDEFDFGFAVDWMVKDLGIALTEAEKNGVKLETAAQVLEYYKELQSSGGGRMDTSSLISRLI